jgi:tetratricopeptide (TPR) repeat protein
MGWISGRGRTAVAIGLVVSTAMGLAGCHGGSAKSAQKYFDQGAKHFQNKDYDDAIAAYLKGIQLEPTSAVGYNLLGMAYRWKYNVVRASVWKEKEIDAFRKAVAADSTFYPAYINLGATLYYMGQKSEAAPYFERALVLYPGNPERQTLEKMIREGGGTPPGEESADDQP